MGQRIRSSTARCLAVLVTPFLVLAVMAGTAPASAASSLSHESGGRTQADAAVPASLRAAIGASLGTPVPAAGYSRLAELTASDRGAGDNFGYSVAMAASGTTALVGAEGHHFAAGAAYVFTLRGGTWSQTAVLTAPHAAGFDQFGDSVALSARGTTALVGALGRNSGTGAAYVFTLRGGTWSRTAVLTASRGAPNDQFGLSVALSAPGTTALVGAGTGATCVFTLRGGTWSQTGRLTASRGAPTAFGYSVALSASGTTALVGALGRNSNTGAAYMFTLRHGIWSQTAVLTASRGAPNDAFGYSVALSALGSTALVGAPGRNSSTGAAYVFTLRGGTWSRTAELAASRGARNDDFGAAAALSASGTTALVGATGRDSFTGAAYVFTLRGGTWSQTAELAASRGAPNDAFGSTAGLSAAGTTALVGAQGHSDTGAAFVFEGIR
jgi:FG-GAP repeat